MLKGKAGDPGMNLKHSCNTRAFWNLKDCFFCIFQDNHERKIKMYLPDMPLKQNHCYFFQWEICKVWLGEEYLSAQKSIRKNNLEKQIPYFELVFFLDVSYLFSLADMNSNAKMIWKY